MKVKLELNITLERNDYWKYNLLEGDIIDIVGKYNCLAKNFYEMNILEKNRLIELFIKR